MLNQSSMASSGGKKKFKPEHVTQGLFILAAVVGLYMFKDVIWGALNAFWALVILAVSMYVVMDSGVRRLAATAFKVFTRFITSWFVRINPFAIVKLALKEAHKDREQMNEQIISLNEAIGNNERMIEKNNEEIENERAYGNKEKQKGRLEAATVHANQVGRLMKFNEKLIKLTGKMKYLSAFLENLHEKAGFMIQDKENELKMQEAEYKSLKAGSSAFKKAMNIYKGNADALDMKNMAIEEIELQIGNFRGQIDKAMRDSSKILSTMETMDEVNVERGLEILNSVDKQKYDDILKQLDSGPVDLGAKQQTQTEPPKNKFGSFIK